MTNLISTKVSFEALGQRHIVFAAPNIPVSRIHSTVKELCETAVIKETVTGSYPANEVKSNPFTGLEEYINKIKNNE